jgi:peptidoglycan/LPS O-acetylase OafA/YrhL
MVTHHNHKTIASMEGLRGFATLLVFIVHYAAQTGAWVPKDGFTSELIFYLRFLGATGVDLFFVLSGYLIYGMLLNRKLTVYSYIKRRVRRIYPTFLVMLALYLILSFLFPSESKLPDGVSSTVVYIVQNILMLPGMFNIEPIMTVAWTLSYEVFFYIISPIMIFSLHLREWKSKHRVVLLLLLSVIGFYVSYLGIFHVELMMFISGMIIFELKEYRFTFLKDKALYVLLITFLLMLYIRYADVSHYSWYVTIVMFFGYGFVCLDTFDEKSPLGRFFSLLAWRWYGNMSYSYYLIHGITLKFLFMILPFILAPSGEDAWVFYLLFIPCFILTLVSSVLLYALVEKPFSLINRRKL